LEEDLTMQMQASQNMYEYLIRLADDRLILGHRLSEWCGHAPMLEEDIALSNIALDCIGQANMLYTIAVECSGKDQTPDDIVYFREAGEFRNLLLVEQPNGDFARTIVRQFLYDSYGVLLFERLQRSEYHPLAVAAQKCLKELQYHLRHSSHWVIRLGDGTDESRKKAQAALNDLWKYTDEFFLSDGCEDELASARIAPRPVDFESDWNIAVKKLCHEATLSIPQQGTYVHKGGREGKHTEHLGHLLAEMQIVARSFPEIEW
jgi:ring-1,2-phenylacetyl-CoA epoxidase subunit PaaC